MTSAVGKLYGALFFLVLVFSTAMCFITLGVYDLSWLWSVIGVAILVVFLALGGLLVPGARQRLVGGQRRTADALLQAFGALCGAEFFTMALIAWTLGNRTGTLNQNTWYQVLGLLIFLGLLGVGVQGAIAMLARFVHVRNREVVEPRRAGSQ